MDRAGKIETGPLGRTGLTVSRLGLGTVALGLDYGIRTDQGYGRPAVEAAVGTIKSALDQGITFFDTAPAYGRSEALLGQALAEEPKAVVATKVILEPDLTGRAMDDFVAASVRASLAALNRESIDILKIHNATPETIRAAAGAMIAVKKAGLVKAIGVSVYTEAEALAAIESGWVEAIQLPFSLLDQRPLEKVFPAARRAGVGLVVRSILLKGALTDRARFLPPSLAELKQAALAARELLLGPTDDVNDPAAWAGLPAAALRFGLSHPAVSCVLIGAQTEEELNQAVTAAAQGPLPRDIMARTPELALTDPKLVNPALWEID